MADFLLPESYFCYLESPLSLLKFLTCSREIIFSSFSLVRIVSALHPFPEKEFLVFLLLFPLMEVCVWPFSRSICWTSRKALKILVLVQLTAPFLIQEILGPFSVFVPSTGDLNWLIKQWFPQCKWCPQRRSHGQTKQYPACSLLQRLENFTC